MTSDLHLGHPCWMVLQNREQDRPLRHAGGGVVSQLEVGVLLYGLSRPPPVPAHRLDLRKVNPTECVGQVYTFVFPSCSGPPDCTSEAGATFAVGAWVHC